MKKLDFKRIYRYLINKKYKQILLIILAIMFLNSFISITTGYNIIEKSVKRVLESAGIYTEQVKEVVIKSDGYDDSEPGSWKITKKAEWTDTNKVKVTMDLDTVAKSNGKDKDVLFILNAIDNNDKMESLKNGIQELTNNLLSNNRNQVAYFISNGTQLNLTNNLNTATETINEISSNSERNYTLGMVKTREILKNYNASEDRELIVLFITDGMPTTDTPNQNIEYELLKEEYPNIQVKGIQYEATSSKINELEYISEEQYIANQENIKDILYVAALNPYPYNSFHVKDFINTTYFDIDSENTENNYIDGTNINWNFDKLISGESKRLIFNLTLKDSYSSKNGYYPLNNKIEVTANIDTETFNKNSNTTPVLKNYYTVSYDTNPPTGCNIKNIDTVDSIIYQNVEKRNDITSSCPRYVFKGWELADNSVKQMNDDIFIMPEKDVTVRATWTKVNISKSMDGIIHEKDTLWKRIENDVQNNRYGAKEYIGEETTYYDNSIYYYTDKTNNNVKFGNFCWQIVRTTETGGVKLVYNGEIKNDGCNNTGKEQQLSNSSQFSQMDGWDSFLGSVGYMYNKSLYEKYKEEADSIGRYEWIYGFERVNSSDNYYFSADEPTYNDNEKVYTLNNPVQLGKWSDLYRENRAKGYYTCFSTSSVGTCSIIQYVVRSDYWNAYTLELYNGKTLNDINTNIVLGENYTKEGYTYTLTNTKTIKVLDWENEYKNYKNYYICSSFGVSSCSTIYKIGKVDQNGMTRVNISKIYNFGNSFSYSGGTYTLNDTIQILSPEADRETLNTHHYTCKTTGTTCTTLFYVFYAHSSIFYIELKNGKSVEDALDEMLWNDDVNETDSEIKKVIDEWYRVNMVSYTKYLENEIYCNDRSIEDYSGWNPNGGDTNSPIYFKSFETSKKINLGCQNKNDQFTISDGSGKGNGKLTYPVGILTASEANLMGVNFAVTGQEYWLGTPDSWHYDGDYSMYTVSPSTYDVLSMENVDRTAGIRPSISLLPNIEITDGDGSIENPYIISDEIPTESTYYNISVVGNENIIVKKRAVEGKNIILSYNGERRKNIASFKINGKLIEGNKFIMPAEDVEITDVVLNELFVIESEHNPYPNNLHYENNNSIGKIYGKEKFKGAKSLTVTLDVQTDSSGNDWVELYDSDNFYYPIDFKRYGGSTRKTYTITVNGDYVIICFRTNSSGNNYYGFKATVVPNY